MAAKSKQLKEMVEDRRDDLDKALTQSCETSLIGQEIKIGAWSTDQLKRAFGALSTTVEIPDDEATDDMRRRILSLAKNGTWTSHLLARLSVDLLPACAQTPEVRKAARESSEVDLTAEVTKTVLSAAMIAALASGNPYAIAIVAVLIILASLFGGGGSGGGDGGGGKDKKKKKR